MNHASDHASDSDLYYKGYIFLHFDIMCFLKVFVPVDRGIVSFSHRCSLVASHIPEIEGIMIRPTLKIFLFPLTRPCSTGMGRSVTSQIGYP